MKRLLASLLGLVLVGGGTPGIATAASPDLSRIPGEVDASVLRSAISGPVVASGRLTDSVDTGKSGVVAILAWPNQDVMNALAVGDGVSTPTVGWASTSADGSFTARVNRKLITADYLNRDGRVNFIAVGWTSTRQATWSFPATLAPDDTDTRAAAHFDLKADRGLTTAPTKSRAQGSVSPNFNLPPGCTWTLQGYSYAWVQIGMSWPYGADTAWMNIKSTHSSSIGVAISSSGTFGSWTASGSTSVSNGAAKNFSPSTAYQDYELQHKFGTYRCYQAGFPAAAYRITDIGWAGPNRNSSAGSQPTWSTCGPNAPGTFIRNRTDGSHLSLSAGVKLAPVIGINLSYNSNYGSDQSLSYKTTVAGTICGSDNDAAFAEFVKTSR